MREVAGLFLRLGLTAFGGPAAHIAMMEEEVVRRRGWLSSQEFLDMLGAVNLVPGPNSTELAIFIGYRRAGWPGLLLGGLCFILPAALLTLGFAWAYVRFGALPRAAGLLYGIKPVVIAIVVQAVGSLGRTAVKDVPLAAIALGSAAANFLGVGPVAVLLGAGAAAALLRSGRRGPLAAVVPMAALPTAAAPTVSLGKVFLFFLKVGSVLYGSGYVLLAFLRADLVDRWHWLSSAQLLDAVAVGQFTPGPVFTTATFIGYLLGGVRGAALATVGIFLPSFFFIAASGRLIPKLRGPLARAFLDGVNAASLALMGVVLFVLARSALVDLRTIFLAFASLACLLHLRWNSAWLILAGGLLGLAFH